jgi:hypothetical protein
MIGHKWLFQHARQAIKLHILGQHSRIVGELLAMLSLVCAATCEVDFVLRECHAFTTIRSTAMLVKAGTQTHGH